MCSGDDLEKHQHNVYIGDDRKGKFRKFDKRI